MAKEAENMTRIMDCAFRTAMVIACIYGASCLASVAIRYIRSYLRGKRLKQIKEENNHAA